jgi:hypothetical protein
VVTTPSFASTLESSELGCPDSEVTGTQIAAHSAVQAIRFAVSWSLV